MQQYTPFLLVVAFLVVGLLLRVYLGKRPAARFPTIDHTMIDEAADRFTAAVQHHAEVNAVMALTEVMNRDPQAIAKLREYSRELVVAAYVTKANLLGSSAKQLEELLAKKRRYYGDAGYSSTRLEIERIEEMLVGIYSQLEAVNHAVSGHAGLRAV